MEYEDMTIAALVAVHNEMVPAENALGSWKQAKAKLIERIQLLEQTPDEVAEVLEQKIEVAAEVDGTEDKTEKVTIGSVVTQLVMDATLSYDMIVNMIHAQFKGAQTSRRSVASVAARLRKDGVDVPLRRNKGALE